MTFEPITGEEFFDAYHRRGVQPMGELAEVILALTPGTGFKIPCIWKHEKGNACYGSQSITRKARTHGFKVKTRHHDGMLLVFRPKAAEEE